MADKRFEKRKSNSWDGVADWYVGWSGRGGSRYHRDIAIPITMRLLDCRPGERVLDVGCGPGYLARHVLRQGATYTGIDLSGRMIRHARDRNHSSRASFIVADATALEHRRDVPRNHFDAAVCLFSIQDINPLKSTIHGIASCLRVHGRLVILMTHPCFRIPRQSGWGWDPRRKLRYRRIDRYLTDLDVPMQTYENGRGTTRSYHRPVSSYVRALAEDCFQIDVMEETPVPEKLNRGYGEARAQRILTDIPLFLSIRARLHKAPI